ncbi:uncharacterized protein Bfra_002817 [Botrytis fragariae]|uniref:Uncharacterized protein n=1 Tax=Botrytis fragariae TaxID=1964551 RepID=A0A8H6AZ18_9HELO|nr:uncharacterized protein Bfra_002817 [Botrytis fragariae]KAF5876413.1 hypothetical protein Bfra_002817 [Botrytis fragariae]
MQYVGTSRNLTAPAHTIHTQSSAHIRDAEQANKCIHPMFTQLHVNSQYKQDIMIKEPRQECISGVVHEVLVEGRQNTNLKELQLVL